MTKGKTRVREHVVADMSFHYLGYIIASAAFTLQTIQSDYGYDLASTRLTQTGSTRMGTCSSSEAPLLLT
jgi:hypothetical protein